MIEQGSQASNLITTDDESSAAKIMSFIKTNVKKINACNKKEIILVLGNTGNYLSFHYNIENHAT